MTQGKSIRISKEERNLLAGLLNKHIAALQDKCKAQTQRNESNYQTFREIQQYSALRDRMLE